MVLILDGNSELGANIWKNLYVHWVAVNMAFIRGC